MLLTPIGTFHSEQKEPYQAGRQPDEQSLKGYIQLEPGKNFEQALQDLDGCSHLWIIFGFHLNKSWKPLVQTPRSDKKIGVFATRAPYRPNPLGLSLVKLERIAGLKIEVEGNDLLDGTPIYDIKPYHPEHDQAQNASIKWLEDSLVKKYQIVFSPVAQTQLDYLENHGLSALKTFICRQLEYDPLNSNKKRVVPMLGYFTLSYRTWRVDFTESENTIAVLGIRSGYTEQELKDFQDPYSDKKIHRLYCKEFI